MLEDAELLRSYAAHRSDADFAELVRRHLNFVYSAALRQANGDVHLAQDATQLVFMDLARKAAALGNRAVLAGWLFTSTRFAVSKLIRTERRRQAREEEAQRMSESSDADSSLDWERVRPVLDEALAELNDADREAVLLRFFECRDFASVGAKLRLTENAARMRVDRALDKLRAQLSRRGLTSTTAALAVVLANQAVVAAPAGLAATITGSALVGAPLGVVATFMIMNKITLGVAGAIVLAGSAGYVVQARTAAELHAEIESAHHQNLELMALRSENLRLAKSQAEIAALRTDDALAQLNDEAEQLNTRLNRAVRAQAAANASARARADVFEPGGLDRMPRATSQVAPKYPASLKTLGTEGEVVVDFVVDADGVVRNAHVSRSTQREFEDPAVAAVSQWVFEPGQKGGRQVNTHLQVPIVFKLAPGATAAGAPVPYSPPKQP